MRMITSGYKLLITGERDLANSINPGLTPCARYLKSTPSSRRAPGHVHSGSVPAEVLNPPRQPAAGADTVHGKNLERSARCVEEACPGSQLSHVDRAVGGRSRGRRVRVGDHLPQCVFPQTGPGPLRRGDRGRTRAYPGAGAMFRSATRSPGAATDRNSTPDPSNCRCRARRFDRTTVASCGAISLSTSSWSAPATISLIRLRCLWPRGASPSSRPSFCSPVPVSARATCRRRSATTC